VRTQVICILAAVAVIATVTPSFADAAPPREPPGSNILPAGTTMVQMVAESVVISIPESGSTDGLLVIDADFAMQNQGEATEIMQVRFPLENPDGEGDSWGEHPTVFDFSVRVNQIRRTHSVIYEPLDQDYPIYWAAFEVEFPPNKEVIIEVEYKTYLYGEAQGILEYIFHTGAGWYGPIGSAALALRLPYAASPSNVYIEGYLAEGNNRPDARFVGNEIRWQWFDFEPTAEDNFSLRIVWPQQWLRILELESRVSDTPRDVDLVIELSYAYMTAGSGRKGFPANEQLSMLSENVVRRALALQPNSSSLHAQLARVEWWRLGSNRFNIRADDDRMNPIYLELSHALYLDQENEHATDLLLFMQAFLGRIELPEYEELKSSLQITPTPTIQPTSSPILIPSNTPTVTPSPTIPTSTTRIQHSSTPTDVPAPPLSIDQQPIEPARGANIPLMLLSGFLGVLVGFGIGQRRKVQK
jgi:hypothetical protein